MRFYTSGWSSMCLLFFVLLSLGWTLSAYADVDLLDGDNVSNGTDFENGCVVNVFDGATIGLAVDLSNGELNVFGGDVALAATSVATGFTNTNNVVRVSGGNIGPFFQFFNSTGIITGGTLDTFGVFSGSEVTIEGGTVTGFPDVFSNGIVNIRGGSVNSIRALAGSEINIEGSDFSLDGTPFFVAAGETVTLPQRNMTLAATLADGSHFEIFLRPTDPGFPANPVVLPTATVNLIGVELVLLGDINRDGEVNLLDVAPFVELLSGNEFDPNADINMDAQVNLLDVSPFVAIVAGQ